MAPFGIGKKGSSLPVSDRPLPGPPMAAVQTMRDRGLTNNQVIQALQREGYSTQQIVDAMNQAEIQPMTGPMQNTSSSPDMEDDMQMPDQAPALAPQEPSESYDDRMEEIAEAIIDEKWNELLKQVSKIVEWKKETEGRIQTVEARFDDLKARFETLQKGVLQKVQDYDRNISSVGNEIKAMEKVFQKVLPDLTDNVNELSRITQDMRKKK